MTEPPVRSRIAAGLALAVSYLAGLAAVVLAVHVAFVVLDANPRHRAVDLFAELAGKLAPGFGDLVPAGGGEWPQALGYGLAAACYLLAGQVLSPLIRRLG